MIICGFPGTGKSMMAKFSTWVDLESTPFREREAWLLYAEVAKHMSDNGYNVMVSTHKELLDALEQIETRYTVVVPPMSDKENYMGRYYGRENSPEFIEKLHSNWERWISDLVETSSVLKTVVILPKDGCMKGWADEVF